MSETRLLNVALNYARARHAYRKAVVQAIAGDDDDVARRDHAYNAMEFAADVLERDGLEHDAQHSLPDESAPAPLPWHTERSEGVAP